MSDHADEFFAHKAIHDKKKKEKIPEVTVKEDEEEWYIEDPDSKPDRVAFVRVPVQEFKTKAS